VLPNSVAGRETQCHWCVNYPHLSFRGLIEEGPRQTLRQSTPGAAPRRFAQKTSRVLLDTCRNLTRPPLVISGFGYWTGTHLAALRRLNRPLLDRANVHVLDATPSVDDCVRSVLQSNRFGIPPDRVSTQRTLVTAWTAQSTFALRILAMSGKHLQISPGKLRVHPGRSSKGDPGNLRRKHGRRA
jgi:hypothetical protein